MFEDFTRRATGTCICRVSAVAGKLITFQCFDNFQNVLGGFFCTISAIAETICEEREMNVFQFSDFFSVLKFCLEDGDNSIKTNNTNTIGDVKPSVLWHSMENRVNFSVQFQPLLKHYLWRERERERERYECVPL